MAQEDLGLFRPELVFLDAPVASRAETFDLLERALVAGGFVAKGWRAALDAREEAYPTGLAFAACAVAIPHVDPAFVERPYIAVVRPQRPVAFRSMADPDQTVEAEFVFNLGVKRDDGQVAVLQQLMGLFFDEGAVADLRAQHTPETLLACIGRHFA